MHKFLVAIDEIICLVCTLCFVSLPNCLNLLANNIETKLYFMLNYKYQN